MIRRRTLAEVGGYDERLTVAQDYDLWMRISRVTGLANLPTPLVIRRLLPGRVSAVRDAERLATEVRVRWRAVRSRAYPWWCAIFLLKPVAGLLLPGRVRDALRGLRSTPGTVS